MQPFLTNLVLCDCFFRYALYTFRVAAITLGALLLLLLLAVERLAHQLLDLLAKLCVREWVLLSLL